MIEIVNEMYKAVIFDLDGTLVNTLEDLADACNEVLKDLGFAQHPVESYRMFVGEGAMNLMKNILPGDKVTDELISIARKGFDEHYAKMYLNKSKPYDGIIPLIETLKAKGIKLAILSNKPDAFTQKIAAELFSENTFDVVMGQRPDIPRKPDPLGVNLIISRLGVDKKDTLYAGDSGVDMKTARAAELFSAGVLWGFRSREELTASGADTLISDPKEILRFF